MRAAKWRPQAALEGGQRGRPTERLMGIIRAGGARPLRPQPRNTIEDPVIAPEALDDCRRTDHEIRHGQGSINEDPTGKDEGQMTYSRQRSYADPRAQGAHWRRPCAYEGRTRRGSRSGGASAAGAGDRGAAYPPPPARLSSVEAQRAPVRPRFCAELFLGRANIRNLGQAASDCRPWMLFTPRRGSK